MSPRIHTLQSLAVIAGLALTGASAHAAVIATLSSEVPSDGNTDNHTGTIQATAGDLLETEGSVASESHQGDSRHVTASLYNGMISTGLLNPPPIDANNAAGYYGAGHFIEFALDTSTNTLGYDISAINIIQRGDSFRPGINVTVSISLVGSSDFVQLYSTGGSLGTADNVNQVAITDNTPALLGSGIDGVRFAFATTNVGWTFYRELDVIGTATVPIPEPSAAALLGLGALAVVRRRRK